MSPRSWQNRIEDILTCAQNIRDYTDGMSFESFLDDPKTIRAVAYEFTTIGEAARVVPAEMRYRTVFLKYRGARCRASVMCWCTSISVWMRKSFGRRHRKTFHP